jgi:preprotein translocase subunit SecF
MKLVLSKQRGLWWTVSVVFILTGLVAMVISWFTIQAPLRPGLDFVGGTRIQLERDCTQGNICDKPIAIEDVRSILSEAGLGNSSLQLLTGAQQSGVSIRTEPLDEQRRSELEAKLNAKLGPFDKTKSKIDTVGPTLGQQLVTFGLIALLISFAGITLYMSVRFQLDYAFWAIVALFHDILITVGVFAILGLTLGVEVDSLFIVALLTIIGFSVNDTVVIYDRVRENLQLNPDLPISDIVDIAVNQTLARSINTSLTALLPLVAIFIFGGETLKYFALALIVGFIAGAYSSIFIASTLLVWWRERQGKTSTALSS